MAGGIFDPGEAWISNLGGFNKEEEEEEKEGRNLVYELASPQPNCEKK